jgi:alpha-L-rhamnosidase
MKVGKLKTNRLTNPFGFELGEPAFSWVAESCESKKQSAASIEVALDEAFANIIYSSGKREYASSLAFRPKLALKPRKRYWWRVTVWGEAGDFATSQPAWFETAKLSEDWEGKWITPAGEYDGGCVWIEKEVSIQDDIKSARIYASGLGLYTLFINGKRASGEYFTPGFNAYDRWVQYQTYDVTALLKKGSNRIAFLLGGGIARGRFGRSKADTWLYCPKYACICELRAVTESGELVAGTGEDWLWKPSKVFFSNIYDGEIYDANIDGQFGAVEAYAPPVGPLKARLSLPVVMKRELKPTALITTPKGEKVLDMGQNMAGWLRFKAEAPKGCRLSLQYGEILQDCCFCRDNLRSA